VQVYENYPMNKQVRLFAHAVPAGGSPVEGRLTWIGGGKPVLPDSYSMRRREVAALHSLVPPVYNEQACQHHAESNPGQNQAFIKNRPENLAGHCADGFAYRGK